MTPGNRHAVLHAHQLRQHLRPRYDRNLATARLENFRVGIFDRRGNHDHRRMG